MKDLLKEIHRLSGKMVDNLMNSGMSNGEAQDTVLVILKEWLNPSNPNIEDMKECVLGLKLLLK